MRRERSALTNAASAWMGITNVTKGHVSHMTSHIFKFLFR